MIYAIIHSYVDHEGKSCETLATSLLEHDGWLSFDVPNEKWLKIVDDKIVVKSEAEYNEHLDEADKKSKLEEILRNRQAEYPPMTDYLDAVVKGDKKAIQEYINKCKAVKAKYPKE
jgi:hypothetical protein